MIKFFKRLLQKKEAEEVNFVYDEKIYPRAEYYVRGGVMEGTQVLLHLTSRLDGNLYTGEYVGIIRTDVDSRFRDKWIVDLLPNFFKATDIQLTNPAYASFYFDCKEAAQLTHNADIEQRSIKLPK